MTTEINTSPDEVRRSALRLLGLDEQASSFETNAILQLVTKSDYLLRAEGSAAIQAVIHPSGELMPSAEIMSFRRREREQQLVVAVREFAREFFDLSYDSRGARWRQLHLDCKDFPSPRRWLHQLAPGLPMAEVPRSPNERVNQLIKISCAVFVASPVNRVRRRQELATICLDEMDDWEPAISELMSTYPLFVQTVAAWIEQIPARTLPERNELQQLRALHNRKSKPQQEEVGGGTSKPWWVLFVAVALVKVIVSANNHSPSSQQRTWSPPAYPQTFSSSRKMPTNPPKEGFLEPKTNEKASRDKVDQLFQNDPILMESLSVPPAP